MDTMQLTWTTDTCVSHHKLSHINIIVNFALWTQVFCTLSMTGMTEYLTSQYQAETENTTFQRNCQTLA